MSIREVMDVIGRRPGCRMLPVSAQPRVSPGHQLPDEVVELYSVCGGAELYVDRDCGFRIVEPEKFVPANPILREHDYRVRPEVYDRDLSSGCYLIFYGVNPKENIVIDCGNQFGRNGWCYEGYLNTYASSDSRILGHSLCEVIEGILRSEGGSFFWEEDDDSLGYVYEDLDLEPPCG